MSKINVRVENTEEPEEGFVLANMMGAIDVPPTNGENSSSKETAEELALNYISGMTFFAFS